MEMLQSYGLSTPTLSVLVEGKLLVAGQPHWLLVQRAEYALDLADTLGLRALPPRLSVPVLILDGCTNLVALPEGLDVVDLSMRGCVSFETWPATMRGDLARMDLHGCVSVRRLPEALRSVVHLDLSGCIELTELPEHLVVTGSIDLADTEIRRLPPGVEGATIKWRGVTVPARVALDPESITMREVVRENNAERRRVLVERMGYDRFMSESQADVLDRDHDAGGPRELLGVYIGEGETLVCLSVRCPSTGDRYMLRVPPELDSCHDAAAWIAGFDDPAEYAPVKET